MVVEDIGNQHEDVEFGFRIKEQLLEDEKQMLKSMLEIWKLDRTRLPCLRNVEKGKLFTEEKKNEWAFKEDQIQRRGRG